MLKNRFIPICLAGCLAGLFALSQSPALAAKTRLSITMWRNDAATAKFTKQLLDEYAKKNNVTIDFTYTGFNGYIDKLLASATAGQVPDVVVVDRRMLPRLADNKIVRPLDALIEADKFNYKKELADTKSGVYKKKFYGFPIWGGPILMYYNPAIYAAAGVPEPLEYAKSGKWNWDTFVDVGRKVTKDTNGDGRPDRFGLADLTTWNVTWLPWIMQNGGAVVDEDYTKPMIAETKAIEGLKFWSDLKFKYNVAPMNGQPPGGFDGRHSGLTFGWLSESVGFKNGYKKFMDMQLTVLPTGKAGYATVGGGCPVCVSASSKHPKEAYKLAKWFAMESMEWQNVGAPASRRTYDGAYSEYLSKYFKDVKFVLNKAVDNMSPEPVIHPRYQLMEASFSKHLSLAVGGQISVETAAQRIAADLKWMLSVKK